MSPTGYCASREALTDHHHVLLRAANLVLLQHTCMTSKISKCSNAAALKQSICSLQDQYICIGQIHYMLQSTYVLKSNGLTVECCGMVMLKNKTGGFGRLVM